MKILSILLFGCILCAVECQLSHPPTQDLQGPQAPSLVPQLPRLGSQAPQGLPPPGTLPQLPRLGKQAPHGLQPSGGVPELPRLGKQALQGLQPSGSLPQLPRLGSQVPQGLQPQQLPQPQLRRPQLPQPLSSASRSLSHALEEIQLVSNEYYDDDNETEEIEEEDLPAVGASALSGGVDVDINKLRFILYTKSNMYDEYELRYKDMTTLKNSNFNPSLPTKFIIHGFSSSYDNSNIQGLKHEFVRSKNVNVILLDWKEYNSVNSIFYPNTVKNITNVSTGFGTFIRFLMSNGGLKGSDIHIIGHGLGAHIAGLIGKNIGFKIPRITGLDPAGPEFFDNGGRYRLDATDAVYVDAIHTSANKGIRKPIAKSDFFVEGGAGESDSDHTSALSIYGYSISDKNIYPARKCSSAYEAKIAASRENPCVSSSAVMGEEAVNRSPPGIYYVHVQIQGGRPYWG